MKPYTRLEARELCEYRKQYPPCGGGHVVWCDLMEEARAYRLAGNFTKARETLRGARWIRRNLCMIQNGLQPKRKPFAWCVPMEGRSQ